MGDWPHSLVQIRQDVAALVNEALHVTVDDRERVLDELLRKQLAAGELM
jgi:hypothetical protein